MPIAKIVLGAGTYDTDIDGTPGTVTVLALGAGLTQPGGPDRGEILSILGSNASASATYQWRKDGVAISGATNTTYDTTPTGAGVYDCEITDGVQVADTTNVFVPVLTAGSIDQATPTIGDTLTVSGSNASPSATFQWQADGVRAGCNLGITRYRRSRGG